jgi:hypothetical protein
MNMVYFPSLTYGLPSTSLTFNQLTSIQRYAIEKFISGMGIYQSTPRSLIYGPEEFGGFGIHHLYTEMQGLKINSIISHLRAKTPLGLLIKVNLEYLQLIAGIESPILSSFEPLPYISHNWLMQLRDFLIEINATIGNTGPMDPTTPRPQRLND